MVVSKVALILLFSVPVAGYSNPVSGYSEAVADAELAFPVPGILGDWYFEEGDTVREGAVLAELDSGLESLEIERRKLLMESAEKEYERVKTVFDRGSVVSEGEVDAARSAFEVAAMEHRLAEEQLERRRMRAPFGGVLVSSYGFQPGEAVERNQPVARISDPSICRFVCYVEGDLAYALEVGNPAELNFKIGGEPIMLEGTVSYVSPVVDPASGLVEVKVTFSNQSGVVRPGIAGEAKFQPLSAEEEAS